MQRYQTRQVLLGATVAFALLTSILLICDGKPPFFDGDHLHSLYQRPLVDGHCSGADTTPWQYSRELLTP